MAQYLSEFLNTAFSTYTENDAFNDSVVYPITLTHTTTGTPANGIGTGLRFITETSNTNNEIGGLIEVVTTDVTSGSEDFDFVFKTMAAGATAAEKLRIKSTGELDVAGNLIVSGGRVTLSAASNRDKYRLWNNSTYTIGLVDSVTYGGVDTEKAMTFQMDNNSSQGFWWGDSTHTVAQGAMALTTDGKLTVAHSMRLGYGESDTTTPGATFKLDVNGNIAATTIDFGEVTIGSTTGIDSWKYNGNLFSTTAEDISPSDIFVDNTNGFYLIMIGSQNSSIYKYAFTTAYKVDTLDYVDIIDVGPEETSPTSLFVKADGTKIYIVGTDSTSVHQYDLSTGWNFSTASFVDSKDISSQDTQPHGLFFKPDGTKMYILGQQNTRIYEYNLGTAWDITTATYSQQLSISANVVKPTSMKMTSDGNTLYVLDSIHDSISKFTLSSAWNITSATYTDEVDISTITTTTNATSPVGFDISSTANKVYVLCDDNDKIFEYDTTSESARVTGNRLIVDEDIHVKNNLLVYNNARIHNSLEVANDANVRGDLTVVGTLTAALSGNATTATTLATARNIAISGDVTGTATSFNGSADITISAAITADSIVNADINSAAGIVDTKLATIATAGKVSNSATTATNANTANAIVARDASGNFSAGTITASLSGNASTVTNGAYTTNNLSVFAATTSSQLAGVISDETGSGALVFGTGPTITLPIVNNIKQGYSTTATAAGTTILTVNSNRVQFFTGTNTQVLSLPAPQTMTLGMEFLIVNNSTGSIEVRAANAATVITVLPGTVASCISIDLTAGNGAAGWNAEFVGFSSVTGTGANVLATSPTLVTPTLGVASATSINKVTLTAPATGSTLTIADGKTLTASNTLTFTGTDSSSVAFGSGGTVAYTGGTLAQFAATTSLQLAGVISDETGSGALVFGTSPSFTTSIVAASATMGLFDTTATTVDAFGATTTLNLGYDSTAASTTNISTGAVANATTKTVNIGTGGAAGSTTNINLGSASGGTVTVNNNLTVTGNLTVNGTTTTVNSTTVTLDDPILTLGGDTAPSTDDNKDRGIEFRWHNGSAAKVGFFGFDDSTGRFTFIPDATNTSEVFSGTTGILDVASITGSAASWTTARTITLGGDLSGNVSIDGSANVTLTATIAADSVALGTDTTGNYVASITNGSYITGGNGGSEGAALTLAVDATTTNTASKVVARDSSGNFAAGTITASLSGNASTASAWATGRTITLTGDVTGVSGSWDGSTNISFATTIAANSVALGTDTTGNYVATLADGTPGVQTGTSGLTITSVAGEGTAATIAHADTSSAANLTATSRTYVTGLTFDTFGHVTAYTTGSETVTDTNTTYSISTETGGDIYSEIIRLTAGGSGSGTDDIILAVGATGTTYGLTIAESGDTITFAHADTSTLSGSQGSAGIASISVDEMGHVTAVTTATYLTSQSSDFGTITVTDTDSGYTWAGTGSAVADATGDTLTLVSGSGINIDVDAASDAIRITNTFAESDTLSSVTGRGATTATAISITNATNSTSTSSGALIVTGGIGIGGDLFVGGGDISAGNIATTLLGGNTTTNISFANALTSGTLTVGGTSQTGTMTIDPSTSAHTLNIGTGANTSGTKTVNIATGSTTSGVTAVTIGSTNSTSSVAIRSGTGGVDINSIKWPTTDGSIGQALVTNGAGQLNFQNVAGGGIVASSYIAIGILSTDQTVTSGADTLINFVDYDDAQSWWNPTTKRFTPTIAGYYDVTLSAWWVAGVISNNQTNLQMRKNGNSYALSQEIINTSTGQSLNLNRMIYLNGTTDYLDFTVFTSNTTSQVLQKGTVDGSGTFFSAALITSGGLTGNIVEDTTPQLGGNLDVNGQSIVSAVGSNGNILITPDGTGYIQLDGLRWPTADGSNGFLLSTNGSGQLAWTSAGSNTTYTISAETATNTVLRLTGSDASTDNVAFVGSGIVSVTRTDANTITITGTEADTLSSVTGRGATTATAIAITNTTASTTVDTGALTVDGGVGMNGNLFVGGLANIAGNLTVSGGTITAGNVATTLLGGNTTAAVDFATAQTSGALTIGGTAQSGTITLDRSTVAHTLNIATGVITTGLTKTINLGTGGASGSITAINIGSSTSGATNTVNIFGDLTVTGTTTYVNTTTLNVGDNIITLNADETGTPSQNAGIEIERGTSTNTALIWNETTDRWQFTNDGSTYFNIPTSAEYSVPNNGTLTLAVSGNGLSGSATFTANQSSGSTFTVASNATNANTGSTIVFRDASGDFSAGTITSAALDTATAASHYWVETASDSAIRPKTLANVRTEIVTTAAVNAAAATTVGTVTSGTWSASFGAVSGANLTSLTADNLSGTIPSGVLGNSSLFVGTTSIALNRGSANLGLTGITSIAMPGSTSGTITVTPAATAGTTAITIPATTGTLITSGDTGTVTSTMIANDTIVNADINASAGIVDTKLATIATAGKVSNSATTATNANTASAIVARDANGDFSAGTITTAALDTATAASHYYVETGSDGAIRPKTLANVRTEIVTTAAVNAAAATTVGTVTSGIWNAGAVSSTGAFTSTLTGVTTTGGGQLYLNGATSNRIDFNINGVAAPAFTTRSAGTKVVYYPAISGSAVDYAVGINTSTLWHSVPTAAATEFFRWFGGTTVAASLTGAGTFTATGDVCAYSDVTLKDNIEVISDPLTKVLKLRGVTFTRKDLNDNRTHMGVIAQEVEEVIPEVVITGDDGIKTVAYGNMVGLLIEAVKELTNQNKELAEKVAQLESKLNG
jgi:6-phosphogluconolactonase (cycloisomerase 2 family)